MITKPEKNKEVSNEKYEAGLDVDLDTSGINDGKHGVRSWARRAGRPAGGCAEETDLYGNAGIATYYDDILDAASVHYGSPGYCYPGDWNLFQFSGVPASVYRWRVQAGDGSQWGNWPAWSLYYINTTPPV